MSHTGEIETVDAKGWWGSNFKARKKQKSAFSVFVGVRGMPNPLHWGAFASGAYATYRRLPRGPRAHCGSRYRGRGE